MAVKGGRKVRIEATVPRDVRIALERLAEIEHRSISSYIGVVLHGHIKERIPTVIEQN